MNIVVSKLFIKNLSQGGEKMKKVLSLLLAAVAVLLSHVGVYAQTIDSGAIAVNSTIGPNIATITDLMVWIVNVLRWFGWAGVIIGVMLALFALIYKLFSGDNEEAMKNVQGYLTKAVLIVVIGIVLLGAGFLVTAISALFGGSETFTFFS